MVCTWSEISGLGIVVAKENFFSPYPGNFPSKKKAKIKDKIIGNWYIMSQPQTQRGLRAGLANI
jgi:hypothetical protein